MILALLTLLPHMLAGSVPSGSTLIDVGFLNVLLGAIIPVLVDAVTHAKAPPWVKAVCSMILSAVAAVLTQVMVNGGLLVWRLALLSVAMTFATNLAAYLGVWKPLQVGGTTGAIQRVTGGAGIGAPSPQPPAPGSLDSRA